ncbi:MAG: SDR family NAD(P)-dependent oxidoreductase [Actinomycetota bacterium]
MELTGTVGILTGASRGIGVYLAEHLAKAGVNLALAARSESGLEAVAGMVRSMGVEAITVPADVTRRSDLQRIVKRTNEELGDIDLLVNNAGIEHYSFYEQLEPNEIEHLLKTNVLGPQLLTRHVLPQMIERRKGHIVNLASVAGLTAVPYNTIYSASKHALVGFSRSLREEMAEHNVGVSVICPVFVREAGMFQASKNGAEPPGAVGTVDPDTVAARTIKAIRRDTPEVVVAARGTRFAGILLTIAPRFTSAMGRRSGAYEFNKPKD